MSQDWLRAGVLSGFVCWLTVFPLSGQAGDMLWFLVPHAVGLLLLAATLDHRGFHMARRIGAVGCVIVGIVFVPMADSAASAMLVLLGLLSAPVSIQMGVLLRAARSRTLTAAVGLAGGNILAVLIAFSTLGSELVYPLLSLSLFLALTLPGAGLRRTAGAITVLRVFLPFIFGFQMVSGLMYGSLMPAYAIQATWPGLELFAYVAGTMGAVWLFRQSQGLTLLIGVVSALSGFALWLILAEPLSIYLAMMLMLVAAGVIDLFLLALIVSLPGQIRAYGYGFGVLCAGIVAGRLLGLLLGDNAGMIGFSGLILLNIAVICLFLPWSSLSTRSPSRRQAYSPEGMVERSDRLDPEVSARLSGREQRVLELALNDMTYRQIGEAMEISESSVKTYMQRIFRKTGLVRRHQLDQLLVPQPSDPD